ncbi:hypothetical protein SANA_31420 [Gottschalkiaceae bacterium SANA]|nr:hypothetical protein SANA_31420 [Gottschalkiaceae bacterium SANA]
MKRKVIIFTLIMLLLGQTTFAGTATPPPNVELTKNQELFYSWPCENPEGDPISGITYYPKEEAVYVRMSADNVRALSLPEARGMAPELDRTIAVSRTGLVSSAASIFYRDGYVYDFEVDQGEGFLLAEGQGPYLIDASGNGIPISNFGENCYDFEVFGNQIAWIGRTSSQDRESQRDGLLEVQGEYRFAVLPDVFNDTVLEIDRVMPLGFVDPVVFDFSADGSEIIAAGYEKSNEFQLFSQLNQRKLYIETLPIIAQPLVSRDHLFSLERNPVEAPRFEVKVDGYGEDLQSLLIGDMYTTEEHIVVIILESNQRRVFLQRYSYDGKRVDQIETTNSARWISPGPNGSTLYLQNRFVGLQEPIRDELRLIGPSQIFIELIQMNWDEKAEGSGGMRPVIAERTFGGQTFARFTDKKFGLLKQVEEETGIVDYRAPLKAQTNDLRLQIPYCDLLAKAGMGARNLMISYQGQELGIPFDLLLSLSVDEMPCQDDATIEIHLQIDEEGNISYTIELFVVEQVDGMTKVVHRKRIQ